MKSASEVRSMMDNNKKEFISTYLPKCLDKINKQIIEAANNGLFSTNVNFLHEDLPHITSHCFAIVEKICSELNSKGYSVKYIDYDKEYFKDDDARIKFQFVINWAWSPRIITKFLNDYYVNYR